MPIIISSSPEKIVEYRPISVFPILLPSSTPKKMKIIEKAPIEIEAKRGKTPVNPAPKPIAKQLIPSTNPKKTVSFQVIFIASSNLGSRINESVFLMIVLFLTNGREEKINHRPSTSISEPPAVLAIDCEK